MIEERRQEHDPNRASKNAAKPDRTDLVFEIKEGDKLAVREVAFAGNNAFAATKLKGEIKTGETNVSSFCSTTTSTMTTRSRTIAN